MCIKNNLEKILKAKGIDNISEAARILQVSRNTLYRYLKNEDNESIRLNTIIKFMKILDVSFTELFDIV